MARPSVDPRNLGHFFPTAIGASFPVSAQPSLSQLVSRSAVGHAISLLVTQPLSSIPISALQIAHSPIRFARATPALGKYVSLSLEHDDEEDDGSSPRVRIKFAPAGTVNEVPRDVFSRVLTGALLIDFPSVTKQGEDVYSFVKSDLYEAADDIKVLHRLGPQVNLTTHDSQLGDGTVIMDVKVHLDNTVINVRYGTSVGVEKGRMLRHASKVVARKAWERQKDLLTSGRHWEANPWTPNEKEQLLSRGYIDTYEVHYVRDVKELPELAGDVANVAFVKAPKGGPKNAKRTRMPRAS